WFDVVDFKVELTNNGKGIIYNYTLSKNGEEFTARELFFPESQAQICGTLWRKKGVEPHIKDKQIARLMGAYKSAAKIYQNAHHVAAPLRVTHRKNAKKEDVISRKDFFGGNDD
ncbi:hypothetical protein, partial [Hafnia sp.]